MKKLTFDEIKNQQLVDLRLQLDYQEGHFKNSLNLNPKNFKKYATDFLASDQPIVFIADNNSTEALEELETFVKQEGLGQVEGYILNKDIPDENLQQTETIPADEFLNKEDDYILLDVRHPDEITRPAPEKKLLNIPLEYLPDVYQTINQFQKIYTLCGSGNRGTSAASFLSSKGYGTSVIEGGMKSIEEELEEKE